MLAKEMRDLCTAILTWQCAAEAVITAACNGVSQPHAMCSSGCSD